MDRREQQVAKRLGDLPDGQNEEKTHPPSARRYWRFNLTVKIAE
jgi:hypothetical protein